MTEMNHELSRIGVRQSLLLSVLLIMTIVLLLAATVGATAPGSDAIVRPDPLISAVSVGGQVVVNLYVQDVQNLYGADIRLEFDPAILEVQDANPNASGVQILPLAAFLKPDFVARNQACNTVIAGDPGCTVAGIVRYAVTQVNPSAPVGGSGPLAAVTFKRLKPDTATLTIITHDLADRYGATIPSTPVDGRVDLAVTRNLYLPLVIR